jgi:hypothetical protein
MVTHHSNSERMVSKNNLVFTLVSGSPYRVVFADVALRLLVSSHDIFARKSLDKNIR